MYYILLMLFAIKISINTLVVEKMFSKLSKNHH